MKWPIVRLEHAVEVNPRSRDWADLPAETPVGFVPMAAIAFYYRSNHLLWLSLALFMGVRVVTLGTQVPRTLHLADTRSSD